MYTLSNLFAYSKKMNSVFTQVQDEFHRTMQENIVILENGVIRDLSFGFMSMFQISAREAIGCPIQDFIGPGDHELTLRILCKGINQYYQTMGLRGDGMPISIEILVRPEGNIQIVQVRKMPFKKPTTPKDATILPSLHMSHRPITRAA